MFLDEARIVSRIRHPNVVATLDVVESDGELFLVMEYVHGESLGKLLKACSTQGLTIPIPIAVAIAIDTLEGLHAAHEATAEDGAPLGVVHRDISPQNLIVGVDGVTHVADFGIAKAVGRLAEKFSVENTVKGKAGYMAPEQLRGKSDRCADVFAVGVVLWGVARDASFVFRRVLHGDRDEGDGRGNRADSARASGCERRAFDRDREGARTRSRASVWFGARDGHRTRTVRTSCECA